MKTKQTNIQKSASETLKTYQQKVWMRKHTFQHFSIMHLETFSHIRSVQQIETVSFVKTVTVLKVNSTLKHIKYV